MMNLLAKSLSDKEIMGQDGTVIGVLQNIIADLDTGDLLDLVVKPDASLNTKRYRKDGNFVLISFNAVKSAKDYIMVDKMLAEE